MVNYEAKEAPDLDVDGLRIKGGVQMEHRSCELVVRASEEKMLLNKHRKEVTWKDSVSLCLQDSREFFN